MRNRQVVWPTQRAFALLVRTIERSLEHRNARFVSHAHCTARMMRRALHRVRGTRNASHGVRRVVAHAHVERCFARWTCCSRRLVRSVPSLPHRRACTAHVAHDETRFAPQRTKFYRGVAERALVAPTLRLGWETL